MTYNFPKTVFADSNNLMAQIIHLESEIHEAWQAATHPDLAHTAEELMDVLHSCETALRILEENHGVNLHKLRRDVEIKNRERSYYAD